MSKRKGAPISYESSKTRIPSSLLGFSKPSSSLEQIIPLDETPLNFVALISSPLNIVAPTFATTTFCPFATFAAPHTIRSEEHTSELQSRGHLVCRLLLEKKR